MSAVEGTFLTGLPCAVTVKADGSVTVAVDLAEITVLKSYDDDLPDGWLDAVDAGYATATVERM